MAQEWAKTEASVVRAEALHRRADRAREVRNHIVAAAGALAAIAEEVALLSAPTAPCPRGTGRAGRSRLRPESSCEVVRAKAGSPDLTVKLYDGLYHDLRNEPEQQEVLDGIVAWLDAHLEAVPSPGSHRRST
jgi:alpha-beta hydrolase superfamily lysophospholipase